MCSNRVWVFRQEETWIRAAQDGDRAAFDELVDAHGRAVLAFLRRLTGSSTDAEDLAQEVFLRIYRSAKQYRPEAKFSTWLYKIATNVSLTHVKRKNNNLSLDEISEKSGEVGDAELEIPDEDAEKMVSVADAMKYLQEHAQS